MPRPWEPELYCINMMSRSSTRSRWPLLPLRSHVPTRACPASRHTLTLCARALNSGCLNLYENTLTPHGAVEDKSPGLALAAWAARILRKSLPEFIAFVAISYAIVALEELVKEVKDLFEDSSGSVVSGVGALLMFAVAFPSTCTARRSRANPSPNPDPTPIPYPNPHPNPIPNPNSNQLTARPERPKPN